jgi:hypothetical protein
VLKNWVTSRLRWDKLKFRLNINADSIGIRLGVRGRSDWRSAVLSK